MFNYTLSYTVSVKWHCFLRLKCYVNNSSWLTHELASLANTQSKTCNAMLIMSLCKICNRYKFHYPMLHCRNVGKTYVEKFVGVKHKISTLKSISNPNSRLFNLFCWKVDCFGKNFTFSKIFLSCFLQIDLHPVSGLLRSRVY